jgi:sarcosine oxidase
VKNYDVIVIGVGSMGSAACYWLAKRGYKVLGLEQFDVPHDQGSHAGQSRIIRKAYFEHPDYVPLLQRAYYNWQQLEKQTGTQVYFETGVIYHGPSHHLLIKGVREAAGIHAVELNKPAKDLPQFHLPAGFETLYEPGAGFLRPEKAITLYKEEAIRKGAVIHVHSPVLEWKKENGLIKVLGANDTYNAKKLIITAGAWAGKMIPHLNSPLKITRQLIAWVKPGNEKEFLPGSFPCWLIADDKRSGALYGFPFLREEEFGKPEGMKFAWHHPAAETDPDKVDRNILKQETDELLSWVAKYIPAVGNAKLLAAKTCLYANSADENFIIDHLPGYDGDVTIACGFSGHGFKFVSVVGEILADLSMNGKTSLPVDFLSLKRFK